MSTSSLYHAFGIRGYEDVRTSYEGGRVIFTIRQDPEACRCSACGSAEVRPRGHAERHFRTLPIGSRPTTVVLPIPRVECRPCGVVRQVDVSFAEPRRTCTEAFERLALDLGRCMRIRDVALHLGVGWDMVKDIQKRDLSRGFARPKLKHLGHIAIDEIAVAEGHRYLTLVMDLQSGAVAHVGDGKGADALKPFRKRLRPRGAKIDAVAMDMSAAYRRAVASHLPEGKVVFDRFRVVKLSNGKPSDLRREVPREAADVLQKRVIRGTRWLLLKDPENLDADRDEKRRPEEALAWNKPLATAYDMKEDLRRCWEQPGKRFASAFLDDWIRRAGVSGIRMLPQMAATLAGYRTGLPAYNDAMITSGPMEGTNNKIKTMKRQAYGFRDQEFFKLKILAIHGSRYALIG
jgi:transposase